MSSVAPKLAVLIAAAALYFAFFGMPGSNEPKEEWNEVASQAPDAPSIAFTPIPAEPNADAPLYFQPAPAADGRPIKLDQLESLACAECHTDIAGEWSRSLHALAWEDQRFQDAIAKKRKPQSCQGCHIPNPILHGAIGRKPSPRADTPLGEVSEDKLTHNPRHFGVSCISCHGASDGAMLGPIESSPDNEISGAHASRKHDAFGGKLGDALCIACHRTNVGPVIGIAKDFESTRQADKGLSCVGCHMAPVERSNASGLNEDGTKWSSPVRKGRSHELQTPRDPRYLALAFGLEAERTSEGAKLIITNQAGHRVPGLRDRFMTFTVSTLDRQGVILGQTEHVIETDNYLAVDARLEITVVGKDATRIAVHATHTWDGVPKPVTFIERQFEL